LVHDLVDDQIGGHHHPGFHALQRRGMSAGDSSTGGFERKIWPERAARQWCQSQGEPSQKSALVAANPIVP
jgi:hypothetical protein